MDGLTHDIESLAALSGIAQLGVVIRDMDRAMRVYSRLLGVRGWFRTRMLDYEVIYRGQPADVEWDIVLGYSRGLQIELIRILSGEQNLYHELLGDGEGFHHVATAVSDLAPHLTQMRQAGIDVLQQGTIHFEGGAVAQFAYLDTLPLCGFIVELVETRLFGVSLGMPRWLPFAGRMTGATERVG